MLVVLPYYTPNALRSASTSSAEELSARDTSTSLTGRFLSASQLKIGESASTPTAPGQFNPPGWDRSYDYGTPEHQQAEPYLFPEKEVKFKFWDLVNAIVVFYIGWETYKYYKTAKETEKGVDFLTIAIFSLLSLMIGVLGFSKFLGKFSLNKFQEENR